MPLSATFLAFGLAVLLLSAAGPAVASGTPAAPGASRARARWRAVVPQLRRRPAASPWGATAPHKRRGCTCLNSQAWNVMIVRAYNRIKLSESAYNINIEGSDLKASSIAAL
ncbi:hypothetical protein TRIUR3_20156 [Triticum urartu]|uniref:Uncharacterized protein n=1 Tax=Triticum urartu TaxID=4572 RepID=M7ZKS8_TRIUA|nr:hypothetical protein TRIUR3_20156 [Triticum urartu]